MAPKYKFLKSFVISFSWNWSKMKTNIITDILPLFPHLTKFCFSSYGAKYCGQIKLQDSLKCNISRNKQIMKFICIQINTKVFYKLIRSFWVCATRHAQSSQNKKFTYLCNSPKNVENEVNFLATNKYKNFRRIDINLGVCTLPFSKYPK